MPDAKERWVEWVEPFGPNSEPVYCSIPESTAIAFMKDTLKKRRPNEKYSSDERALEDFMAVYWAEFRKE